MPKLNYEFSVRDAQATMGRHAHKMRKIYKSYGEDSTIKQNIKESLNRDEIVYSLYQDRGYYFLNHLLPSHREEPTQKTLKQLKTYVNFATRQLLTDAIVNNDLPKSYSTAVYMTIYKYVNHEMKQALKEITR